MSRPELEKAMKDLVSLVDNTDSYSKRDVILFSCAFIAAAVGVVPNVNMSNDFVPLLAQQFGISDDDAKGIAHWWGTANAIVNIFINTIAIEDSVKKVRALFENPDTRTTQLPLFLIAATIAATPTISTTLFGTKDEGVVKQAIETVLNTVINIFLNMRGLQNALPKQQEEIELAFAFRLRLLNLLNAKLGTPFKEDDIKTLATGQNIHREYPRVQQGVELAFTLLMVSPYAMSSGNASSDAMDKFLSSEKVAAFLTDYPVLGFMADGASSVIAVLAGLTKFLLLGRANKNFQHDIYDELFNRTIIQLDLANYEGREDEELKKKPEYQRDKRNAEIKKWGYRFFHLAIALGLGIPSLGSAMELVYKYLFDETNVVGSAVAGTLGAIINIKDADRTGMWALQLIPKLLAGLSANGQRHYDDVMGETPSYLYRNAMLKIVNMTDAEILRKFYQPPLETIFSSSMRLQLGEGNASDHAQLQTLKKVKGRTIIAYRTGVDAPPSESPVDDEGMSQAPIMRFDSPPLAAPANDDVRVMPASMVAIIHPRVMREDFVELIESIRHLPVSPKAVGASDDKSAANIHAQVKSDLIITGKRGLFDFRSSVEIARAPTKCGCFNNLDNV